MKDQRLILDDNLVILSEDANALHKMYEALRKVLETQSISMIRLHLPRAFAEDWIKAYEKLRHFMDVNKLVKPS